MDSKLAKMKGEQKMFKNQATKNPLLFLPRPLAAECLDNAACGLGGGGKR